MKFLPFLAVVTLYLSPSVHSAKKTPQEVACEVVPEGTYIAHPEDCKKFFKCQDGVPTPGTCSGTTTYSVVDNACMKSAICVNEFAKIVCRNRKDGEKVADPMSCQNYYTCAKGKANSDKATPCDKKTPSFDSEKQACVAAAEFECPPDGHCALIADQIFTAHSNSKKCWAYFLCMNNIAIAGQCKDGYGFHFAESVCDYGYECPVIKCDNEKDTPIPETCSQYHSCKTIEINPASTCPPKHHFDIQSGKCAEAYSLDEPCKYDRCENMPDGSFVAARNTQCKKYYYCLKGKIASPVTSDCSAEYPYLNEEYQQCIKSKPSFGICN